MKKIPLFSLLFFSVLLPIVAGDISIFDGVELPYFTYFNKTQYQPVAYFEYHDENNYSVGFDGSGYSILTTGLYEKDDVLFVEFIKIWNGAEESYKNDRRKILKYCVSLSRQTIVEGKELFDIEPVFVAEDTRDGVPGINSTLFCTNGKTTVISFPSKEAEELFVLNKGGFFELKDIVFSSKTEWIKISKDGEIGYIPFSSLATHWKILKSECILDDYQGD